MRPVSPALRMETIQGMRAEMEAALKEPKALKAPKVPETQAAPKGPEVLKVPKAPGTQAAPKKPKALKAPETQAVLKKPEAPAKEAALPQPAPMKPTARQRAAIPEAIRLRLKAAVRIMSLSLKMSWNHLQTAALPQ